MMNADDFHVKPEPVWIWIMDVALLFHAISTVFSEWTWTIGVDNTVI
jgi:hypothetical protein